MATMTSLFVAVILLSTAPPAASNMVLDSLASLTSPKPLPPPDAVGTLLREDDEDGERKVVGYTKILADAPRGHVSHLWWSNFMLAKLAEADAVVTGLSGEKELLPS